MTPFISYRRKTKTPNQLKYYCSQNAHTEFSRSDSSTLHQLPKCARPMRRDHGVHGGLLHQRMRALLRNPRDRGLRRPPRPDLRQLEGLLLLLPAEVHQVPRRGRGVHHRLVRGLPLGYVRASVG